MLLPPWPIERIIRVIGGLGDEDDIRVFFTLQSMRRLSGQKNAWERVNTIEQLHSAFGRIQFLQRSKCDHMGIEGGSEKYFSLAGAAEG